MKPNLEIPDERRPAVAGRFYPAAPDILVEDIEDYYHASQKLTSDIPAIDGNLLALVSPHAGYVFSGTVAASAFSLLRNSKIIKRVILIGSSHYERFSGASIYYRGCYSTPLGKVEIDSDFASSLLDNNPAFSFIGAAHKNEHSLEVQLPFLQYFLKTDFKIVPILIDSENTESAKAIADALKPSLGGENLFVISTDLSHYPEYHDAIKTDKKTIDSVCSNNPAVFLRQLKENHCESLHTSMCGWMSMLTLLYMTEGDREIYYQPVLYQNSGEVPVYGDKSRVVGYQSLAVYRRTQATRDHILFTEDEKRQIISIARKSIIYKLSSNEKQSSGPEILGENLQKKMGAFVSIYCKGELRGCIGRIETNCSLQETIAQVSVMAATSDNRFLPLKPEEINEMSLEISVLTPLKPISNIDEIIPGKHGILIRKGYHSGTFLPQVATKTKWDTLKMVEECSERKAGIGKDGWKDADIYIYEAVIISENKD